MLDFYRFGDACMVVDSKDMTHLVQGAANGHTRYYIGHPEFICSDEAKNFFMSPEMEGKVNIN